MAELNKERELTYGFLLSKVTGGSGHNNDNVVLKLGAHDICGVGWWWWEQRESGLLALVTYIAEQCLPTLPASVRVHLRSLVI